MTNVDDAACDRTCPRPLQAILFLWLILALALTVRTCFRPASHTCFPVLAGGADHWWADEPVYANYRPTSITFATSRSLPFS